MKGVQKELIANASDQFSNMEFFKATYFEVKLDRNKMRRIFEQKDRAAAELSKLQASKRVDGQKSRAEQQRCVSISPDEKKQRDQKRRATMSGRQYLSMTHSRMNQTNLFESKMTGSPGAQRSLEVKLDIESMDTARSKESMVRVINHHNAHPNKTRSSMRPATMYNSTNFTTTVNTSSNVRESGGNRRTTVFATIEKDDTN